MGRILLATTKIRKNKEIKYYGEHQLTELQNKFFAKFDYNFWMHKALVLTHFISNPESISMLKFEGDISDNDVVMQSLKMEIHMTAMHSMESLFRIFHSLVFNPDNPWLGMAQSTPNQLHLFILIIKRSGITSLISNSNEWLRAVMYPTIDENHSLLKKSKDSVDFVISYLNRLEDEFVEHKEYNAYKHGLHCFPGSLTIQAVGEQSGRKYIDSSNDVTEFLEFGKTENDNSKKVFITTKAYSNTKDFNIIRVNSAIMHNLFKFKGLASVDRISRGPEPPTIHHGYYYFDDQNVSDMFLNGDTSGPVKRFTY